MPSLPENIVLLLSLAVFAVVSFRNIRFGACLVIFSMLLYLVRFSVFGIPSTMLEAMIYVLFFIWLARKGIKKVRASVNIFLKEERLLSAGMILLFLGLFLAAAHSANIRTSLGIIKGWFFDPFLFFIVFIKVIKTKEQTALSLFSWLLSGLFVSLIAISYLLTGNLTYDGRLRAFFSSPNHLAMYLAPAFLILAVLVLSRTEIVIGKYRISDISKSKRFLSYLILPGMLVPLFYTSSYGAFFGISAALAYAVAAGKKIKLLPKNKVYASILVLAVVIGIFFVAYQKIRQVETSQNRSSLDSRLMIWQAAEEMAKSNFPFGIGPGTFQEIYLSYADKRDTPYLEWAVPQPHNVFLAFYLQTGLLGLLGFILVLAWFFRDNRISRHPSGQNEIATYSSVDVAAKTVMVYFLAHGLVDTTYWKNDLALMFWVLLALKYAGKKQVKSTKPAQIPEK